MVTELATNEKKQKAKAANEAFWERFQFLLWINDDIICQRYFRINGYNRDMCHTEEFTTVMENCVRMIQDDLKYKSFILQSYTCDCPIKLTGFVNDPASESDVFLLSNPNISGNVTLSDGRTVEKTYFEYPDGTPEMHYMDNETLEPWDVVFKFQFLIDDKTVYERIWDGTQYPKYVRNSVDLTNSNAAYRDKDPQNLNFSASLQKHMTFGRKDLTYHIIKSIIDVVCFDGNGYTDEWKKEAKKRGLDVETNVPKMFKSFTTKKAIDLFTKLGVYSEKELEARNEVKWETYTKKVQIEGRVIGRMAINHIIPAALAYQTKLLKNITAMKEVFADNYSAMAGVSMGLVTNISELVTDLRQQVDAMVEARKKANAIDDEYKKALAYHEIAESLFPLRKTIDKLEEIVDNDMWPLPKYRELLFIN